MTKLTASNGVMLAWDFEDDIVQELIRVCRIKLDKFIEEFLWQMYSSSI